jgi:phosphatidylglycerol---prolipoprotein diacylglyceryl transferase
VADACASEALTRGHWMLSLLQSAFQLYPSPYILARLAASTSAVSLAVVLGRRAGIRAAHMIVLAALCIPLSVVGGRVLDAIEYAATYPSLAQALARNGSSIYGGLTLSFLAVWAYTAWRRVPMLRLLDAGAPAMALGEALSRVGCFLGGCCYGVPWQGPWAVTFPRESFAFDDQVARGLLPPSATHSLAVHPVQLYSAVMALAICLWLVSAFVRRRTDGVVFFRFLVAYGGLRLVTAPLRMEALASTQAFSVAFIVIGAAGLVAAARPLAHDAPRAVSLR